MGYAQILMTGRYVYLSLGIRPSCTSQPGRSGSSTLPMNVRQLSGRPVAASNDGYEGVCGRDDQAYANGKLRHNKRTLTVSGLNAWLWSLRDTHTVHESGLVEFKLVRQLSFGPSGGNLQAG